MNEKPREQASPLLLVPLKTITSAENVQNSPSSVNNVPLMEPPSFSPKTLLSNIGATGSQNHSSASKNGFSKVFPNGVSNNSRNPDLNNLFVGQMPRDMHDTRSTTDVWGIWTNCWVLLWHFGPQWTQLCTFRQKKNCKTRPKNLVLMPLNWL